MFSGLGLGSSAAIEVVEKNRKAAAAKRSERLPSESGAIKSPSWGSPCKDRCFEVRWAYRAMETARVAIDSEGRCAHVMHRVHCPSNINGAALSTAQEIAIPWPEPPPRVDGINRPLRNPELAIG